MLYDPEWDIDRIGTVLLRAADYIDEHGWCQRALSDDGGRVCVIGALLATTTDAVERYEARARLEDYFNMNPVKWNNRYGCTKEQVVGALRAAAAS